MDVWRGHNWGKLVDLSLTKRYSTANNKRIQLIWPFILALEQCLWIINLGGMTKAESVCERVVIELAVGNSNNGCILRREGEMDL